MRNSLRAIVALGLALPAAAFAQSVSLTGAAYTENFNTLASTGTGTTLPNGWHFVETGSGAAANGAYTAGTGSANGGDTYSFGAAGNTERALGGIRSGTVVPLFGAQLTNNTGAPLSQIDLQYTGEQWRVGTAARPDKLDFQFSTDATSLTTGTWLDVDALDFTGPSTAASGPLDGNTSRTTVSGAVAPPGSLAVGAAVWIRWVDADAATADDGLAIDDVTIATGPAVDVAPTVASTSPSNAATNVAAGADVVISFSEAVTASSNWFSLSCSLSGNRTIADFAVTGGSASYTLNPASDFAFSETCSGTVVGTAIVDQDDSPDALGANYVFSFTTAAEPVDVAPTVGTITPANAATNISPDASVQIVFSEPVMTNAAAFALSCESTVVAFAFSGSGTTYVLDPSAALPELSDCSVAIESDLVTDMDGSPQQMVADFLATFTTRAGSANYYGGVDASSCSALRTTLHATIDDHLFYPYTSSSTDTWDILNTADQDPMNAANVVDVYRNASYTKIPGGVGVYNREHTWPNSYGFNNREQDEAYTDTHMLYVSDSNYNTTRNNLPFDNCPPTAGCTVLATVATNGRGGGPTNVYPGNHNWYKTGADETFEVWDGRKGDIARAILYMDIRYEGGTNALSGNAEPDLVVTDTRALIQGTPAEAFRTIAYMGMKSTLIAWHNADPPDVQEQLRNDIVQSYQGNRNPFIDHPEWVATVFQSPCGGPVGNVAPVFADASYTVLENAASGSNVASVSATDANAGQTVAYSIVSGNESGAFALSSTGALTVANAALIDGAVVAQYSLVLRATDNGTPALTDDATITINVTPVNDAPSFARGADQSVQEDAGLITVPNWANAISAGPSDEAAQTVAFEVTGNTQASLFSVAPSITPSGTLSYTLAADANGTATITIRLTDNGGTANGGVNASAAVTFTINVAPVDEPPDALFEHSFE